MGRQKLASVLEIAGSVAVVVGVSMVAAAAGFVVAGGFGLLFAWRLSR